MSEKLTTIFREGYDAQKSGDFNLAIEKISEYASLLPSEINHEPYYWLSYYYTQINHLDSAVSNLQIYANGYGDLIAAKILKEAGNDFEAKGFYKQAKELYLCAMDKNPKIGLSAAIKNLQI